MYKSEYANLSASYELLFTFSSLLATIWQGDYNEFDIEIPFKIKKILGRSAFVKQASKTTATARKKLQWHQAFYAGIQIEFADEADKLIFENEHHLGTQPKRIDVLIIKKDDNTPILKNIGRIFRKHNIIEYKSPDDYISVNDYYLVYGYACLYKADGPQNAQIPIEDITITLVSRRYPKELIKHLQKVHHYNVQLVEKGIYYIKGDLLPIQLLVTQELTDEQNLWLHNLTNDIQDSTVINSLVSEYEKHQKDTHYESIMDILVHANQDAFKEVTTVCKALEDLYWEVHGERIQREQKEALDKAVAEAVDVAVAEAVAKAVAEAVTKTKAEVAEAVAEKDAYIKQLELQLGIASA